MKNLRYTHVIWDWNGTLLNDVAWNIHVMNTMLAKRGLPVLESLAEYYRVFRFPVIDYYRSVGFDFNREPFEQLAIEFIALWQAGVSRLCMFPDAEPMLLAIRDMGIRQVILSASEQDNLLAQMEPHSIARYFDEILGISDIYAGSKLEVGRTYLTRAGDCRALLIGDSTHDFEVASALGADCILVSRGHQSAEALRACGVPVVGTLDSVLALLG